MTVTYKGMTQDFEYRVAEVNYEDYKKMKDIIGAYMVRHDGRV